MLGFSFFLSGILTVFDREERFQLVYRDIFVKHKDPLPEVFIQLLFDPHVSPFSVFKFRIFILESFCEVVQDSQLFPPFSNFLTLLEFLVQWLVHSRHVSSFRTSRGENAIAELAWKFLLLLNQAY